MRYMSSTGTPLSDETHVNTYISYSQDQAAICCFSDKTFIVIYESEYDVTGSREIFYKKGSITEGIDLEQLLLLLSLGAGSGDNTGLIIGLVILGVAGGGLAAFYFFKMRE